MHKPLLQLFAIFMILTPNGCFLDAQRQYPKSLSQIYFEEAEEATLNQQYDIAERKHILAIKEDEKANKNVDLSRSYLRLAKVYYLQGRFDEAAKIARTSLLGDIYLAQGKYDEASKKYELAGINADKRSEKVPPKYRGHKIIGVYPLFGNYCLQIGEYEKAKKYYQENLEFLIQVRSLQKDIAISKNRLAMAYFYDGDNATAEKLFGEAAGLNANAFVTFPEDLAISLTMLGWIAEHRNEIGKALEYYQAALSTLREHQKIRWGIYRVEQADVLNRIGRFYIKQNNLVEAERAYSEAIQLRKATATTAHPNYADSLKGMADVTASRSELTSATLQVTKALKVLDKALVPTHPRYAHIMVASAAIHELTGKTTQSDLLFGIIETILQKPLGPWKEDFLETAKFYLVLLKKAGKNDVAARLEQLRLRQKDGR